MILPRKVIAEGDQRAVYGGGVVDHEERLTGDHAAERAKQSASAQVGVHGDAVAHPGKRTDLGIKGLAGAQAQGDGLHDAAHHLKIGAAHGLPAHGHYRIGQVEALPGGIGIFAHGNLLSNHFEVVD